MATPRTQQDVKVALARGLQELLLKEIPLDRSAPIPALELHDASIEAQEIGPLMTQIRVRSGSSIRYFTVTLAERM